MLLEFGGAQVFMDWRSIVPGSEWSAALECALADYDVLCVFWSAAAQRSTWVRAEYTTFIVRSPDRRFYFRPALPLRGARGSPTMELGTLIVLRPPIKPGGT